MSNYTYVIYTGILEGIYTTSEDLKLQIDYAKNEMSRHYIKPKIYKFKSYQEAEKAYNDYKLNDILSRKVLCPSIITRTSYEKMPRVNDNISCFPIEESFPQIDIYYTHENRHLCSPQESIDTKLKKSLVCHLKVSKDDNELLHYRFGSCQLYNLNLVNSIDSIKIACMLVLVLNLIKSNFSKLYYVNDNSLIVMFCLGRIYSINANNDTYDNKQLWNAVRKEMECKRVLFYTK